jgi:hypothetical protein
MNIKGEYIQMTNDEINIKRDDLMKILELSGVPLSAVERMIDIEKSKKQEEEQKKKEKDNPPFVQLYKGKGINALKWLINESQLAGSIFMFFLENMNNKNMVVCSQQVLAEEFGKGRTSIYKAIKLLDDHNFINIAKIGTANTYILNPEITFQSGNDKKKYVSFEGTVLLSKEENKALFEKYNYESIKVLKEKKSTKEH